MSHAPRTPSTTPAVTAPATVPSPPPSAGATVATTTLGAPPTITQPAGSRFMGPEAPDLRRDAPAMTTRLDLTP